MHDPAPSSSIGFGTGTSASRNVDPERRPGEAFDRGRDWGADPTTTGPLIVVSNRQPYSHEMEDGEITVDLPTGGVTAGLDPVMREIGGTWIAWGDGEADRDVVDDDGCVTVPPDGIDRAPDGIDRAPDGTDREPDAEGSPDLSSRTDPRGNDSSSRDTYTLRRVWLSDEEVENYYYGFSNQVLWPICHSFLGHVDCADGFWETYRTVNERFAANAVQSVRDADADAATIWFHDYHFALAPRATRRRLGSAVDVVQFWHVPWPAWDTFRACPRRRDLLRGLLGCDWIGFHTERYVRNFLQCVATGVDDATVDWERRAIQSRGRRIVVRAVPMGVPVDEVREMAESAEAATITARLAAREGVDADATLAVGVDRLDYTKGIPERLRALERLWADHPEHRGDLTYVQVGSVSREEISAYASVQAEVRDCVTRINERFGTDDWQPVVYTTAHLSREVLFGLYRAADLALVSPIRDGMNLVAQEFVAAQGSEPGVLLLSRGTGSYDEFGEHALAIDPCDVPDFATTIEDALTMPSDERRRRMAGLRRAVNERELSSWVQQCLRPDGERPRRPATGRSP